VIRGEAERLVDVDDGGIGRLERERVDAAAEQVVLLEPPSSPV